MKITVRIAIATIILIFLFSPLFVYAQTDTSSGSSSPILKRNLSITLGQTKTELQANRVVKLREKADREIDRRITALQKIVARIGSIKRLSADQKSSLTTQIQVQIADLTNLKSKIDANTDIEILKTDIKSIVNSYRIYLLFIPKIHILAAADEIFNASDKLMDISTKLQTKITDAKTAGKDVLNLETALTDMQNKITDAKKQAEAAQNAVLPLTPDGYPGNKTTLQNARTMLQTGRHDLQQAKIDAKTIINGLKKFKITTSDKTTTSSSQ